LPSLLWPPSSSPFDPEVFAAVPTDRTASKYE